MLKVMATAIAVGIKAIWKATASVADDILALALSPLRAIFGGGRGGAQVAAFQPDVNPAELLAEIREQPKRTEVARRLDRDAMRSVMQYVKATPIQRATIDLSAVANDVRATLLTMDEHELRALAAAGDSAIRRFADGKSHRVHGVPTVGRQPAMPVLQLSVLEHMEVRVRQRFGEPRPKPFTAKIV